MILDDKPKSAEHFSKIWEAKAIFKQQYRTEARSVTVHIEDYRDMLLNGPMSISGANDSIPTVFGMIIYRTSDIKKGEFALSP